MDGKRENIRYTALIACHTMMMCAGFNYITYYLLSVGVSDRNIGLLIGAACLLAVFIQQVVGRRLDAGRIRGKELLLLLSLVQALTGVLVCFLPQPGIKALVYGIFLINTMVMQPVVNAFSFHYKSLGIEVNYGIARGFGSLCYSLFSMVMGYLTVRLGSYAVPASCALLGALSFLTLLTMPPLQTKTQNPSPKKSLRITKYPAFLLMILGLVLVMLFHNLVMTYFIYVIERAGGNSGHMGVAVGIAGLAEIPVLFLYTRIRGKHPSALFLAVSGMAFFAKAALFLAAKSIWVIYAIQGLQCLSYGLMAASRVYYVDEVIGEEYETTGQAWISASETVGIVLGSALGGLIMDRSGIDLLLWAGALLCLAGAICMVSSAVGGKRRV